MNEQRTMGTIKPAKKTATTAWRKAVEVVGMLEMQEALLLEQVKAVKKSLEQARAVERSAKLDLCRLLDDEEPLLPGMGRATEPE
jgi:predicted RNA-binding protein with PUA-like domain